jgi:hypothetical protein
VAADRPLAPPNDSNNQGVNLVYESNEANNVTATSTPSTVTAGTVPDLAVSNVTVPATATAGQSVSVGWKVTNGGAATGTVPITDSVYLSLDQVFDPNSDHYLGSAEHDGGLAAGANYTLNASFPVPGGFAGTY